MHLVLDGRGRLYAQLARALKQAITSGRIADGSRIPPTRDMVSLTGLSRTTIVAAYQQLQAEGYLECRVGAGSYVRAPKGKAHGAVAFLQPQGPQSAYARRARALCKPQALPGARDPSLRYAFQYGVPQLSPTLPAEWSRLVAKVAPYVKPTYPAVQGMRRLRDAIASHIRLVRAIDCSADDILIVNGTQQAISISARVLLDPGDRVALEEPQYFGTRQVLQVEGMDVFGIPVDDDGLRVDLLVQGQAKVICVTPSHQFPTGALLSQARRAALLEYAYRNDAWIIEDDYDGDFRHEEAPIDALHSMDRMGRVIYVGSFSKTLFPAIRLGFVVMPRGLRDDFIAAKWASDFALPALEQAALAEFISSGAYDRHVRRCTKVLVERRQRLRRSLADTRFANLRITGRNAGMHLLGWLDGCDQSDMRRLVGLARDRGLGLYSTEPFYLQRPSQPALMLGFSSLHASEIPAATTILGDCLHAMPGRVGVSARRQRAGG